MKCYDTYDDLPKGAQECKKKTTIMAVQMTTDFEVITIEGKVQGKAGDWLAKGIAGELYPIAQDIFEKSYEVLH